MAFAGILPGQVDSKSNPKTAIPMLLDTLELRGAVVSIDATGTHPDIEDNLPMKREDCRWSRINNTPFLKKNRKNFARRGSN